MKLNNKGFALTSIIYMLIVLFLMIMLLVLANLATRKVVLDKMKNNVKNELNQGGTINSSDLPYQNITSGIYYETLELAFKHAKTGDTIKVLKDVEDTSTPILNENKEVKIDLAGNEISLDKKLTNNGTLDIYSSENDGTIISPVNGPISNIGTLTINGTSSDHTLSIINNSTTTPKAYSIIDNFGTATLNNKVTLKYNQNSTSGSANRYVITNSGTTIVNGATIINNMDGTDKEMGISNTSTATNGSIIVNSGTIETSNTPLWNNGSTKNTTGTPAIKVVGGTIKASLGAAIINSKANSMVYITGGEISSTGSNTIENIGNINITGGTISSLNGRGVQATTGTITIGKDDGNISQTTPSITAKLHGVEVTSGTINFYDGKVTSQSGSGSSISGTVATPTGYSRKTVLNGTTETSTLGWATDSNDTLIVNDTNEYSKASTLASNQYEEIKQYTINAPFTANSVYQLEVDAKGTGYMYNYFWGASGYWQVQTIQPLGGTAKGGGDGNNRIDLTSEWKHYEVRFTLKSSGNANVNKYLLFRVFGGNTAYIKNIKFYKIN